MSQPSALAVALHHYSPNMTDVIRLVGPNNAVEIFGVTLVGVNATNGRKVLFTVVFARQRPQEFS